MPSGIAFIDQQPTEEEINAAAYLGVPLVQIDDLQESVRKDYFSLHRGGLDYDKSFYHIKEHSYEDKPVKVLPNDYFDQMMIDIITEIKGRQFNLQINPIEISTIKDETGFDEYIVKTASDEYSAIPVYDYVDSDRMNIDVVDYERDFVKMKLYDLIGTKPKLECVYGKYPNGKIALSILENKREDNEIDKCINFLSGCKSAEDIDLLSTDAQSKMKILTTMEDEKYIELFENLIAVNNYTEPKQFVQSILNKRNKIKELLVSINKETAIQEGISREVSTQSLGKQVIPKMANTRLEDEYEQQIIASQERANQYKKYNINPDL